MSLVTIADVTALVATSKTSAQVQAVIDRVEAEVVRLYGAHYVDDETAVTETLAGGYKNLFLRRRIGSVDAVTEDDEELSEDDEEFRVWGDEGRLQRLPSGSTWGEVVEVEYVPVDDSDERKRVIVELVRLDLERSAMKSESVAGEYSYSAPEWEVERANLLRSLGFPGV